MTGPMAGPRRCAIWTVPMARAICSRGTDSAAIDTVRAPYPAKTPSRARRAKSCHGAVTKAIAPLVRTKAVSERRTSTLLP